MIQLPDNFTDRMNESLEYYMNQPIEIYLTRDKLCKCITKCTDKQSNSWCYVDKECPNNTSGYRGYYKLCNPNQIYDNIEEADKESICPSPEGNGVHLSFLKIFLVEKLLKLKPKEPTILPAPQPPCNCI